MPKCTRNKSRHTSAEAGLLAAGCDAQIYVISKPSIRVDVPVSQVGSSILSTLDTPRAHVAESIP